MITIQGHRRDGWDTATYDETTADGLNDAVWHIRHTHDPVNICRDGIIRELPRGIALPEINEEVSE